MLLSDDMTRLCNLIYTNPGAYALVIGSGLSSLAGIETAYGIQIQLAKEILHMKKFLPESHIEPEEIKELFKEKVGEFSYESLLRYHSETCAERSFYIKKFIEPTEDDKEAGRKIPTESHNAIAKLVEKGYIKLIISLNFDRLIETALTKKDIPYHFIYKSEDIDNVQPLAHLKYCLIVKPNGDYLSTETKNLLIELDPYPEKMECFLVDVAKTYGIIAFGWSVEYDKALREIFSLNPCNHFSSYICRYNSQWKAEAEELKKKRCMRIIDLKPDDDDFFQSILNGIESLEELTDAEKSVNFETFKRLLVQPNKNISVFNTIEKKTNKIIEQINNLPNEADQKEFFREVVIKKHSVDLCSYLALLTAYDDHGLYEQLITENIEKLCLHPRIISRNTPGVFQVYNEIVNLPCLMALYTVSMVSLKKSKNNYLSSSLLSPQKRVNNGDQIITDKAIQYAHLGIFHEDFNIFTKENLSTPEHVILFLMKLINDQVHIFQDADEIERLFVDTETLIHLIEGTLRDYYTYMSHIFIVYFGLGNMYDFFDSMINLIGKHPDTELFNASAIKFVNESIKLVTELKKRMSDSSSRFHSRLEEVEKLKNKLFMFKVFPEQKS